MPPLPPVQYGFVYTRDKYQIGKLLEIKGDQGLVRVRHSPVAFEDFWYPLSNLTGALLPKQMRVFWQHPKTRQWHVGRVLDRHRSGHIVYSVKFPNDVVLNLSEKELETRSLLPYADPTEALADGWCETQHYYDRRLAALTAIVHARASSWGMTGLTSSAIQLIPHQVEVVRRVLSDPIQRYLLADEVGLGKTIEVGCIIRQVLLDSATDKIVILSPMALVRQWERELRTKFGTEEFPGRVSVLPFEALSALDAADVDMLVIDEAHHLVGSTHGNQSALLDTRYWKLAHIAHSCRRLFVLSATPVFGDEDAMLRLLNLLDPQVHRLDDREGFRRKLQSRQEYGRLLMALTPDARPFVLKRVGTQLLQAFPDDLVVTELAPTLVSPDPGAPATRTADTVRKLRRHISETYRLHQRLLRTRRKDLVGADILPRQGDIKVEAGPENAGQLVWNALEDWRYASLVSEQDDAIKVERFAPRFLRLFEAASQGPEALWQETERQLRDVKAGHLTTFEGDALLLHALSQVSSDSAAAADWLAAAGRTVTLSLCAAAQPITGAPKVVAFTSSSALAAGLGDYLVRTLGLENVGLVVAGGSADSIDDAVQRFRTSKRPAVLVCVRSGEEGLNLHFVDAIVHLDVPLAPGRLEQRIGRVDRFGRRTALIRHFVLLPTMEPGNPWVAWHNLLESGFHIYNGSISDVQFCLEEVQGELSQLLYHRGAAGLEGAVQEVRAKLQQERNRLDEQYALDQLSFADHEVVQAFDTLVASDAEEHYETFDRWLFNTLQLGRLVVSGKKLFKVLWTEDTLMPVFPWKRMYEPILDKPLSYKREEAMGHPEVRLVRPGSHLVRVLERHLQWDDRGTSFATWRVAPKWNTRVRGEWVGFRLTYVVEFNMARVARLLGDRVDKAVFPAIKRRADDLFSPWLKTITLDINLDEVLDPTVLQILDEPYEAHDKRGNDYNLGSRRDALFGVVRPDAFYDLCKQVRGRSEQLIWESRHLREELDAAARRAENDLKARIFHLKQRREASLRLDGITDLSLEKEILINRAILKALPQPRVRLDAIGCFVISSNPPAEVE